MDAKYGRLKKNRKHIKGHRNGVIVNDVVSSHDIYYLNKLYLGSSILYHFQLCQFRKRFVLIRFSTKFIAVKHKPLLKPIFIYILPCPANSTEAIKHFNAIPVILLIFEHL